MKRVKKEKLPLGAKPELVAPAGDWPSLLAALEAGADSVYFGVQGLNMRHYAGNFDSVELVKVMSTIKAQRKKGYLAVNTVILPAQVKRVREVLEQAKAAGIDAVILWDTAVLAAARDLGIKIHLSTQASVANVEALQFFCQLGAERVVLARECTLEDIRVIIQAARDRGVSCQVETFVHGAMCVSISGRCFLSQAAYGKSANQGQCLQPCRHQYRITSLEDDSCAFDLGEDYVLSPKDLCAVEFVDDLIESGVAAFKIEGRMRGADYLRTVTGVYRQAIDAYFNGGLDAGFKARAMTKLGEVYNRGFSTGFYFGQPQDAVSRGLEHRYEKIFIGLVRRYFPRLSVAEVRLQSEDLCAGDEILFLGKKTPALMCLVGQMQRDHRPVSRGVKGEAVAVQVPFAVRPGDKVFIRRVKERG